MYRASPGRFMADWFDAEGKRHRASFPTAAQAQRHEHQQAAYAHAERCRRELDLSVHHVFRHKTARATAAKRAAAIITAAEA